MDQIFIGTMFAVGVTKLIQAASPLVTRTDSPATTVKSFDVLGSMFE